VPLLQVSEGINFADEHARAVVLVGIPYPGYKDTKVEQKKMYNDHKESQARGVVSGSKWYNLQAFRAMNQVPAPAVAHSCITFCSETIPSFMEVYVNLPPLPCDKLLRMGYRAPTCADLHKAQNGAGTRSLHSTQAGLWSHHPHG
jgi:hypothetical protein